MTHPLTPRERAPSMPTVELADDMLFEVSPGEVVTWAEIKRRTALASGSGDHAELARLAEAAEHDPEYDGRSFEAAANPATVLALLAENAALRVLADDAAKHSMRQTDKLLAEQDRATEAERKLAEAVGRKLPDISTDGPNEIDDHRYWLARQLLDSKLTADEAYSIVRHFPGISKEAERG